MRISDWSSDVCSSDLLVDTLLYVSEWFQDSMRAECATKGNGIDKLRVFINFGVFETKGLAHTGSRVWAWAMAEAMLSKEMYALIQERRRSFEDMIEIGREHV